MDNKIQVIVKNEFSSSDKNNIELGITVYDRVFRKLSQENDDIGKIFPIYLKYGETVYILGIFALNKSGTSSLFLELPGNMFFDHITFGNTLQGANVHLTEIFEGNRKKVTNLKPEALSNGTHYVLTLAIQDFGLLKKAPRKILYPAVSATHTSLLNDVFFTRGSFNGSGQIEAEEGPGVVVIQLFLFSTGVDFDVLNVTKVGLGSLGSGFDEGVIKKTQIHQSFIGHEFQNDYNFGLVTFRYPMKIEDPLYFGFSVDRNKFYFNSSNKDLKYSVDRNAQKAVAKRKQNKN